MREKKNLKNVAEDEIMENDSELVMDETVKEKYDDVEAEEFEKEIEDDIAKDDGKTMKEVESYVGSSISIFLKDMSQYQMLTPEQEKELVKIAKTAKKESDRKTAKERLLLCNWRLVVYVAKRYRNLGVDFEDLISQGLMGLMTGIDKFDYKVNTRLSTYVLYWIKQSITRYIEDNGRLIRLPVHINDKLSKYKKVVKELTEKLGREPKLNEVAKKMKVSEKSLVELIEASKEVASLDKNIGDDEDTKLEDMIADNNYVTPEENTQKLSAIEMLHKAVATLKEKEQQVLNYRYGLLDNRNRTLEEVGSIMGITRERVRQIEDVAFRKLRRKYPELEEYVA